MATISDRVRYVLGEYEHTRNSDKELLVVYMQKSGMNLTKEQIKIFRSMPSMEAIRRVRQKIQENGEYLPADEVRRERLLKAKAMQITTPLGKPERIESVLINQGE